MLKTSLMSAGLAAALCCGCSGGEPADVTDFDLPTISTVGGTVLSAPRVQPIYFPGFPYASDVDTFFQRLAASTYWPAVVGEYGVGGLTALPGYATKVSLPASVDDSQLQDLLSQALTEGSATLGAASADTVYTLFLSPTSTLTAHGLTFCGAGAPSAYHDEWIVGATHVAVAIVPVCPATGTSTTPTGVDGLTPAVSHELVEAVTDPFAYSDPAWTAIDVPHILWAVAMNGTEIADLCENERPNLLSPPDIGFPVQRIWSNRAAEARTGPCVPVPAGEVYFNAVAAMPTHATFTDSGGTSYSLPAMHAKVGQAVSAQVSFRGGPNAPRPLAAFALELDDANSFSVERPTAVMGVPGQTVAAAVATSGATTGLVPLVIAATDATRTALHFWVGGIDRN